MWGLFHLCFSTNYMLGLNIPEYLLLHSSQEVRWPHQQLLCVFLDLE